MLESLRSRGSLLGVAALVGGLVGVGPAWGAAAPSRLGPKTYAVKAVKDLTYYDGPGHDKVKHKLDLFLPEGAKGYPVVVFVHGGAWLHGDKGFLGFYSALARSLARQGVGVAVVNYRLSPKVLHPEHVKDVARAFAWTRKNVGKYGGDADRVFVCGHSAGGHLAALLASDETYLKAVGLTLRDVRGAIPISGVYVLPDGFLPQVFGKDPEALKKAAPIYHARKGLPPFLILYADRDLPYCDKKPSEAFCKALKDKGTDAKTVELKGLNHYTIIFNAARAGSPVSRAILGFVQEHGVK